MQYLTANGSCIDSSFLSDAPNFPHSATCRKTSDQPTNTAWYYWPASAQYPVLRWWYLGFGVLFLQSSVKCKMLLLDEAMMMYGHMWEGRQMVNVIFFQESLTTGMLLLFLKRSRTGMNLGNCFLLFKICDTFSSREMKKYKQV